MSKSDDSKEAVQKKGGKRKNNSLATTNKHESALGVNGKPVGYKNPPAQHTWKKGGPSPNPSGRRKGSKNLETMIYEAGHRLVEISIESEVTQVSIIEAIIYKLYEKAGKNGDLKIFKYLADIYQKKEQSMQPKDDHEREILRGLLQLRMLATICYRGIPFKEAEILDLPWDIESCKKILDLLHDGTDIRELLIPLSYKDLIDEPVKHKEFSLRSTDGDHI